MLAHDAREAIGGEVERVIPGNGHRGPTALRPELRFEQPRLARDVRRRSQVQRAALAAQTAKVGRMIGVAANASDLRAVTLNDHAAADAAVAAGGLGLFHTIAGSMAWVRSSSASRKTWPLASSLTAKRCVQPASGALAQPSARPMVQLCSGQATLSPKTMPWDSGPPLCGQRSSRAKTLSSALRKIATGCPSLRLTRRAPSTGMSVTRQMGFQAAIRRLPPARTAGYPPAPCRTRTRDRVRHRG